MRVTLLVILLFVSSTAVGQANLPGEWAKRFSEFNQNGAYRFAASLKPVFLESDLSGDSKKDIAIFMEKISDKKKGVVVFLQGSKAYFLMGAGKDFGAGGDDFSWANHWSVFTERLTHETTFTANGDIDGSREVKLLWNAITISDEGSGGGLLYYDGKKFTWIHQGD